MYFTDVMISGNGTTSTIYSSQPGETFSPVDSSSWPGQATNTTAVAEANTFQASQGAGTNYYVADHLGTAQVELSSTGQVLWNGQFVPFGGEIDSNQTTNRYKFTGKERDTESGLDYFGARYLSSNMGRWMSPDPSMEGAILELPQTWNKYSYEYNRPTYGTDPDGRCPPCIGAIIGGVVGGVVEGGFDLGKQLYNNSGHLADLNLGEVGANVVGGAVAGAIAGATGGASLVANAFIGDVAAGATGNIVGSIVTRALDPNTSSDEVMSVGDVSEDALAGFVGGAGGHIAADLVHIPGEPRTVKTRSGSVYRRQMANNQAATNARSLAVANQFGRAGLTSSFATHSTNGILDWIFSKPPCATTSASDDHGNSTGTSGCQ